MRKSYFIALLGLLVVGSIQPARPNPPMQLSPQIVLQDYLLTQAPVNTSLTSIYTPANDGIFRVTGYIVFSNMAFVGTNEAVTITLQWTDELQTEGVLGTFVSTNSGIGPMQRDFVLHVKAGQPIQYQVFVGGSPTPSPYNLYLTVIKE